MVVSPTARVPRVSAASPTPAIPGSDELPVTGSVLAPFDGVRRSSHDGPGDGGRETGVDGEAEADVDVDGEAEADGEVDGVREVDAEGDGELHVEADGDGGRVRLRDGFTDGLSLP